MWFKVDDQLHAHKKVRRLGRAGVTDIGVWALCGSWAAENETDGFVPRTVVRQFDARYRSAARLVDAGLWTEDSHEGERGYRFHDWFDYNPSVAEIEDLRRSRADAGRAGGKKSGEVRRSKREANASANAKQKRSKNEPHTHTHSVSTDVETLSARSAREIDGFAAFWAAYPKRVDRRNAEKAWKAAIGRGVDPGHMVAAAHRYAERTTGREARYIKHASSWLNAGSYDDEPDRPTVSSEPESRAAGWQRFKTPQQYDQAPRRALT